MTFNALRHDNENRFIDEVNHDLRQFGDASSQAANTFDQRSQEAVSTLQAASGAFANFAAGMSRCANLLGWAGAVGSLVRTIWTQRRAVGWLRSV